MNINRHYFSQATQITVSVHSVSTVVVNANKERVFLHIGNHDSKDLFLHLRTPSDGEAGIYVPPLSIYEFSSQKGNLYDGTIYAKSKENQTIVISVCEGYGI